MSGYPSTWDGFLPRAYVLERHFDASKGETHQDGYKRYLQLPFFTFAKNAQLGPMDTNGNFPVMFTSEQWSKRQKVSCDIISEIVSLETTSLISQNFLESPVTSIEPAPKPVPHQSTSASRSEKRKRQKERDQAIERLQRENEQALDEAFEKVEKQKRIDEEFQEKVSKDLAFNIRKSNVLIHNPHYTLPACSGVTMQSLANCIEHREFLVMKVIHHAITLLRQYPTQSMLSPEFIPPLLKCISEKKLCLDPNSGGMDLFFHLETQSTHLKTLALAKLLHIVRVPLCATLSQRQLLHPKVFKSGYQPGFFSHVLFNQMTQNFLRSMSLRHCTLAIHSPDILREFGNLPEFNALVDALGNLEWWCAEKEFPQHRFMFCAPPEGFVPGFSSMNAKEVRLYSDFITHFILQINISDRIHLQMTPFQNKRGEPQYQPFANALLQKMELWRPQFKLLSETLFIPPQIFSHSVPSTSLSASSLAGTSILETSTLEVEEESSESFTACLKNPTSVKSECAGASQVRTIDNELLKILFMCSLGAQTEFKGDCSYSDISEYTLMFLMHPKLSKIWNDRFLSSEKSAWTPQDKESRSLTLDHIWKLVMTLNVEDQGTAWKSITNLYAHCSKQGIK